MAIVQGEIKKLEGKQQVRCAFCDRLWESEDIVVFINGRFFCSGECYKYWYWS